MTNISEMYSHYTVMVHNIALQYCTLYIAFISFSVIMLMILVSVSYESSV